MTIYRKNGFIDLETTQPMGSREQTITLTRREQPNEPIQIKMHNGTITSVTVAGKESRDYAIQPTQGGGKVVVFNPERYSTHDNREYPKQIQINIQPDYIAVGAFNYYDSDSKLGNHLLKFQADGTYSIRSVPPANSVRQTMSDLARQKDETVQIAAATGTERQGAGVARIEILDYTDDTDRMNRVHANNRSPKNRQNSWNLNADGWATYDKHNDQNFNAGAARIENGKPTDFLISRRDESYQRFSAELNGIKGTVNLICVSPEEHISDESFLYKSSATFVAPNGHQQSISLEDALNARSKTLSRLEMQDVPHNEGANLTCGLPRNVEEKTNLKR